MRIMQSELPFELRRIAANHLESIRGTDIGLNTKDLYVGEEVCPIYRPDLNEPAYYEFQILKATRAIVDNRKDLVAKVSKMNLRGLKGYRAIYSTPEFSTKFQEEEDEIRVSNSLQGFILVSTSDHDFPLSHWSLESLPVSHELERQAKENNKKVNKIYKIDAMTYLGEDKDNDEVALIGPKPPLLKGFPEDFQKYEGKITSDMPKDPKQNENIKDHNPPKQSIPMIRKGPRPIELEWVDSDSWKDYKELFPTSFKPMLDNLKKNAMREWDILKLIQNYGEGIMVNEPYYLPVLEKEFSVELSGEVAEYVTCRIVQRPGDMAAVELFCKESPFRWEANLDLNIYYADSKKEHIKVFIVSKETPTNYGGTLEEEE